MAITNFNFSGDVTDHKTYEQRHCSAELTESIQNQSIWLLAMNIFLSITGSITAFLGNALILIALHKESSLHPPSRLLFRSLAITDLCVGIITEPLAVTYWMSLMKARLNICRYVLSWAYSTGHVLAGVSLLILSAISVDRLLVLLLGLRYRQVVTKKRIYLTVYVSWVVSIVVSTMYFWNFLLSSWCIKIGILLCLVTSIYCYTKIFLTVRHHQNQVQGNVQGQKRQAIPINIARYKKAVSSALWLQLTLVVCYLPYVMISAYITTRSHLSSSLYITLECSVTLVMLNSSLNPILYCWKVREVRKAVKDAIRHLFQCSRS